MEYVLGFAFSRDRKDIALIEKKKPDWQAGKLNGIGGKVEPHDPNPMEAMIREFREETGVITSGDDWDLFAVLSGNGYEMYCYRAFNNKMYECNTQEEEVVKRIAVDTALNVKPLVKSCQVLIRMAQDAEFIFSEINHAN